jgi:hypothetical protein
LFGLTTRFFKWIAQSLFNAKKCPLYVPRAFRTPLWMLQFERMLASNRKPPQNPQSRADQHKNMLVINFEPLLNRFQESSGENPPPRIVFLITLIMAHLGPHVTPPEDVRKEICLIADMWYRHVEPMTMNDL